jgi:hypothetical protein
MTGDSAMIVLCESAQDGDGEAFGPFRGSTDDECHFADRS